MAEESFIFLDRVSHKTEARIWGEGILSWEEFLSCDTIGGISASRKLYYDRQINKARDLLKRKDLVGLAQLFPKNQHWRLYDLFSDCSLALDIETSGYYGDITVIGLHDGDEAFFLVKNKNLSHEPLQSLLNAPRALLTFNGSSFDVPIIARRFPQIAQHLGEQVHIDLRHVAAKLGYSGGLKTIEVILGIDRGELAGVSGDQAVLLWQIYEMEQDEEALEVLLAYNEADVKNLFVLADTLIPQLWNLMRTPYK